jgi:hypothetical protein
VDAVGQSLWRRTRNADRCPPKPWRRRICFQPSQPCRLLRRSRFGGFRRRNQGTTAVRPWGSNPEHSGILLCSVNLVSPVWRFAEGEDVPSISTPLARLDGKWAEGVRHGAGCTPRGMIAHARRRCDASAQLLLKPLRMAVPSLDHAAIRASFCRATGSRFLRVASMLARPVRPFFPHPARLVSLISESRRRGPVLVEFRRSPKVDSGGCSTFRSATRRTKQVSAAEPEET